MKRLSLDDYPYMDAADAGKLPNIGYGYVENVRAHLIEGGATALLATDITASAPSIEVDDAVRFPDAPFVLQIAGERMLVTEKSGNLFTVLRGYDHTAASAHGKGRTVFEAREEYVYLVSPEPVRAIDRIYVDGIIQGSGCVAYTGKPGDEHPNWPGRAVVSFQAEPWIGRQRRDKKTGIKKTAALLRASSHKDIEDENTKAVPLGYRKVWAAFEGTGHATDAHYEFSVKNTGATDGVVSALIKESETAAPIRHEKISVPAGETLEMSIGQAGGGLGTEFYLMTERGAFEVGCVKKTVTSIDPPEDENYKTYEPPVSKRSLRGAITLKPKGKTGAWVTYDVDINGVINRQTHYAEIHGGATDAKVRLSAVSQAGGAVAFKDITIEAGKTSTAALAHRGGEADTMTKISVISGEVALIKLNKEISYIGPEDIEKPLTTASARAVIGDAVSADAEWTFDPDGNYGGEGTLIERPDRVIKHYIVNRMEFGLDEIDTASFADSGAFYESSIPGGYRFGFVLEDIKPSVMLKRLATECRSLIHYGEGRWRLLHIPDSSPAPVKTIKREELAGEHADFGFFRSLEETANEMELRFGKDYLEGEWRGFIGAEDAESKAKYGVYRKLYEFETIRDKETAEHVLNYLLLKNGRPVLRVEFKVFWEHFDLKVGDVVEIENSLYGGKKFYIEEIRRVDKFRATVRGREWWW